MHGLFVILIDKNKLKRCGALVRTRTRISQLLRWPRAAARRRRRGAARSGAARCGRTRIGAIPYRTHYSACTFLPSDARGTSCYAVNSILWEGAVPVASSIRSGHCAISKFQLNLYNAMHVLYNTHTCIVTCYTIYISFYLYIYAYVTKYIAYILYAQKFRRNIKHEVIYLIYSLTLFSRSFSGMRIIEFAWRCYLSGVKRWRILSSAILKTLHEWNPAVGVWADPSR